MKIDVSRIIVVHHPKVPYETAVSEINFNKHVAIILAQKVINDLLCNDDNGQLASIYMLVTEPEFRSISFIPDEIKKTNPFFNEDQYNMVEINGLWISPSLKTPMLQVSVWGHLIKDIFLCKKKHVLLMRNSKTKSMERFLNMVNPEILYEGEPNQMSGQKTHQMIEISHSTRWSIILNTPKYIQEFYQRKRRSALHEKQQLVKISRA